MAEKSQVKIKMYIFTGGSNYGYISQLIINSFGKYELITTPRRLCFGDIELSVCHLDGVRSVL